MIDLSEILHLKLRLPNFNHQKTFQPILPLNFINQLSQQPSVGKTLISLQTLLNTFNNLIEAYDCLQEVLFRILCPQY